MTAIRFIRGAVPEERLAGLHDDPKMGWPKLFEHAPIYEEDMAIGVGLLTGESSMSGQQLPRGTS